jgi:serine/threonine protein kinase
MTEDQQKGLGKKLDLVQDLSVFALSHLLPYGGEAVAAAIEHLRERFTDQSQRLSRTLQDANDRAWRTLEIALAGESLRNWLDRSEDKAFREQMRVFLNAGYFAEFADKTAFRKECVRELQRARKGNLLSGGAFDPRALAQRVGEFARFNDPQALLDYEFKSLERMALGLREAGYKNLAGVVAAKPHKGAPLLVTAVRFFFRRAVENDDQLFRSLAFSQLERIQQGQEEAFAALNECMSLYAREIDKGIGDLMVVVVETHEAVLDLQAEQKRLGSQGRDIYQEVLQLKDKLDLMHREVRPRDSLSIRNETERQLVKQLVERYRTLPEDRRQKMPALLNALGQLQVAAGDFAEAEGHFKQVTNLVTDPQARAEAYMNAYRAALEQQQEKQAFEEWVKAMRLDGKRLAPFPVGKYQPKRILGAGGFGVAFLCRHKDLNADVVVKTLHGEDLDRDVDDVLAEARVLFQLDHPCIIRLLDCAYTVPSSKSRPYFVMSYFEGRTLEEEARRGAMAVPDVLEVGGLMLEGLQAAHANGVMHRDVKPANVLVRKTGDTWEVKLIDFGLAMRAGSLKNAARSHTTPRHSIRNTSIVGTVDYAAPEQLGASPGVPVGPYSDLYGWAKTCCFALFGTTQPLPKHWQSLPPRLAELLGQCLEQSATARPASCAAVLDRLQVITKEKTQNVIMGVIRSVMPAWQAAPPPPPPPLDIGVAPAAPPLAIAVAPAPPQKKAVRPKAACNEEWVEDDDGCWRQKNSVRPKANSSTASDPDPSKPIQPSNPPQSPVLMAVLSFLLIGLGQMMLGQVAKGVMILVGTITVVLVTFGAAAPLAPVVWILCAFDAYVIAAKLKAGRAVGKWEFF